MKRLLRLLLLLLTFALSGCTSFPGPNHAINHFRQTIVALIDGTTESPTPRNFSAHHIKCQHFTFALDVDHPTFLDDVTTFG